MPHESNLQIFPVTKGSKSPGGEIFGEAIFGPTEPEVVHRDFASVVEERSWSIGSLPQFASTCRWRRMDTQWYAWWIRIPHLLIQFGDCPGIEIREAEEIRAQIWIGERRKNEKNAAGTLQILEVHPVKSTLEGQFRIFSLYMEVGTFWIVLVFLENWNRWLHIQCMGSGAPQMMYALVTSMFNNSVTMISTWKQSFQRPAFGNCLKDSSQG